MKKLLKSLLVMATIFSLNAAVATYNPSSAGTTSVVSSKNGAISSLIFANSATNAITIGLFDCPTNVLTYTIGAYTNNVVTSTSTVVTFTNILGTVQSQTNSTITSTPTAVAATTNNYPKILTYIVPASSTVTLPFTPSLYFTSGLAATNSATNVIVTINYQSAK